MLLNKDNCEKIKQLLNKFDVKEDRIIATINNGDLSIVPSRKYPLNNKYAIIVLTRENTEELHDLAIQKIYDSLNFELGRCYKNMKILRKALIESNIVNFKTYVGWAFVGDAYPVHHCFIVYNDKYVLDPSMQIMIPMLKEKLIEYPQFKLDINSMRLEAVKISKQIKNMAFSEKSTFGKLVSEDIVYIASECEIEDGENMFLKLIETYPNHPIYQKPGMNAHGLSLTQQMIEKETR